MTRSIPAMTIALAAILSLSACAGIQEKLVEAAEARDDGLVLVRADLEEASRSSHVWGDTVAYTCYDELLKILDENGEEAFFTDASKGVISTFQKVRNTRRLLQGEAGTRIRLACSALKNETLDRVGSVIGFLKAAAL